MTSHHHTQQQQECDCFIGIDVGTQGTKAVLYHPHTKTVIGRASKSYPIINNTNSTAWIHISQSYVALNSFLPECAKVRNFNEI